MMESPIKPTTSFDLFNQNLHLMEDSKKLELAKECKAEGVELFKMKKLRESFIKFTTGIKYLVTILPKDDKGEINPLETETNELLTILYNNVASCHVLKGNYQHAADMASSVLEKDPDNLKALFRRGMSYTEINEYEKARIDLEKALKLDPENHSIKIRIVVLNDKVKKFDQRTAQTMKKLFL